MLFFSLSLSVEQKFCFYRIAAAATATAGREKRTDLIG